MANSHNRAIYALALFSEVVAAVGFMAAGHAIARSEPMLVIVFVVLSMLTIHENRKMVVSHVRRIHGMTKGDD